MPRVDDVEDLARALPQALGPFTRVLRRSVRRGFPRPPLGDPQVAVLRTVEASPGLGTAAVAERLQVAPNTVSTLVGELVSAGLLVRGRSESDRRAATLDLSAAARDGLALWARHREQVLGRALSALSAEDRTALAAALPAVRRLLAELERPEAGQEQRRTGTTSGAPDTGSRTSTDSTP